MAADWIALIKEQGEVAKRMATDVPTVLSDPNLTLDQASKLYKVVERGALDLDSIVERWKSSR